MCLMLYNLPSAIHSPARLFTHHSAVCFRSESAAMAEFMPTPFRGVPGVPHAPEELFQAYFFGAQLALGALLLPGRVFGSELRPRRFNPDHIIAVCDEAARTREAQNGKKPRTFVMKPKEGEENWQKKWWNQLHRRRWMRERMGGGSVRLI